MPTIEEGLVSFIEAEVTEAGKGYPQEVPVDADFPAWSYNVISDDEMLSHGGATGFVTARIQLDFLAKETESKSDYAVIKTIAATARAALNGYQGDMGGVRVDYCKVELNDDWADIHKLPVQRFDLVLNYRIA
jgi:hypothetical protein